MNDLPSTLAVVASTDVRIDHLYRPILRELVNAGVKVYAIAPPGEAAAHIEEAGAEFVPWPLDRRSLNPFSNIARVLHLIRIYSRIKPDMVHHYTVKPNLYGALAAWWCAVPVTFTGVTGLGQLFAPGGLPRRVLRMLVQLLYRVAAELSDRLLFQTRHDIDVLLGNRAIRRKAQVIPGGAGVDIQFFDPRCVPQAERDAVRQELHIHRDTPVVLMASRLLHEKGVTDYVAAAHEVKAKDPNVRFLLAGARDPGNFGSVGVSEVERWRRGDSVDVLGFRDDVRALFALADIVVHPTYYPEGIPRVLIEAAAMGKPIVSTSIHGVEQILSNDVNGIVVPPRNAPAIAKALETLLGDAALRTRYGNAGRRWAKEHYDVRLVVERHMAEYRAAWSAFLHPPAADATAEPPSPVADLQPAASTAAPSVSIIVPARDAEATLGLALDRVLAQEYDGDIEVIVADGSDTPQTADVVRQRPTVQLVPNPHKTIGFGINLAIREAKGHFLLRCDAHSFLPPGYVRRAVETLQRTGAANVGGRQVPVGTTAFERAVAIAMSAAIGAGDARYRLGGKEGAVDTVYLGAFRRDALDAIGGFDPRFFHNQDYEVNWRLRQSGETIWFDPALSVEYRPRATMRKLVRQYFNYGRWKSAVLLRHPRSLRSRHLAPPTLLLALLGSALLAILHKPLAPWAVLVPAVYVLTLIAWSVVGGLRKRTLAAATVPLVLATMHISWAIGFFLPARVAHHGPLEKGEEAHGEDATDRDSVHGADDTLGDASERHLTKGRA